MKMAIISDIHGNLEALISVVEDSKAEGVQSYICLGDIVGYGADPVKCLEIVISLSPKVVIMGNHDAATSGMESLGNFNEYAADAILWTIGRVSRAQMEYLSSLPYFYKEEGWAAYHANPCDPKGWGYVLSRRDVERCFGCFDTTVCFIGHSHIQFSAELLEDGTVRILQGEEVCIKEGRRYLINPGSVGQPRDGDPRASYAIWDMDAGIVSLKRVDYDIASASRKILMAGLPRLLAERLEIGF
jgi:diadenosine tetraphosphatase ApaH/serine/threonine PP2A family protein phosphatase